MSLLSLLGISNADAAASATSAAPPHAGILSALPMLLLFVVAFYFLIVRPQSKRTKEQRQLIESLTVGDEVLTTGGIVGRLTKLRDNYVVITVAKELDITFQKNAISTVLPKGTVESMN